MAKVQPVELGKGIWYLPAAVNTFIVSTGPDRSVLIDTGQDKEYGRRLLRASRDLGLEPQAIINTHAHSDHFGGNAFIIRRLTDAVVMAPRGAATIIREPLLQPLGLFHGAAPLEELLAKWTHGAPSPVNSELEPGELQIGERTFTLLEAGGHDREQFAVLVDDVLIAADGLFGQQLLDKYPLPFSHDPGRMLATIERLGNVRAGVAVPGHGDPQAPAELAAINLAAFERVRAALLEVLTEPAEISQVLTALTGRLGIEMDGVTRYLLNFSTVSSWLGWFRSEGLADVTVRDNVMLWSRHLPYGDA